MRTHPFFLCETVVLRKNGSIGRIDLIDPSKCMYWDVKTKNADYVKFYKQIDSYEDPVRYISAIDDIPEKLGKGTGIEGGVFYYNSILGKQYKVTYWQEEAGVIRYDFIEIKKETANKTIPYRASSPVLDPTLVRQVSNFVIHAGGGGALVLVVLSLFSSLWEKQR